MRKTGKIILKYFFYQNSHKINHKFASVLFTDQLIFLKKLYLTLVNLHLKRVSTECDFSQTVFETELLENGAFYIVEMIQKKWFSPVYVWSKEETENQKALTKTVCISERLSIYCTYELLFQAITAFVLANFFFLLFNSSIFLYFISHFWEGIIWIKIMKNLWR